MPNLFHKNAQQLQTICGLAALIVCGATGLAHGQSQGQRKASQSKAAQSKATQEKESTEKKSVDENGEMEMAEAGDEEEAKQKPKRVRIGGIQWYVDYDAALEIASEEKKPIWLHFGENPG